MDTTNTEQKMETTGIEADARPPQQPQTAVKEGDQSMRNLEFLLDISLKVSVEVGRTRILIKDLLQIQEGGIIELDKLVGDPLDIYVNSRLIAKGDAVLVNDKLGIRLTDVVSPAERIEKLG